MTTTEPVHGHVRFVDPGYRLADLANDLWGITSLVGLLAWAFVMVRLVTP